MPLSIFLFYYVLMILYSYTKLFTITSHFILHVLFALHCSCTISVIGVRYLELSYTPMLSAFAPCPYRHHHFVFTQTWLLVCFVTLYPRISYCTADKMHDKVFAFISQNQHNGTLECHAFLCAKRKVVSVWCFPYESCESFHQHKDVWLEQKESN